MKLYIVGASGKIGQPLVQAALAAGYEVGGVVLNASKFTLQHDKLHILEGDATDQQFVNKTLAGYDAVISVIGHNRYTPIEMQSDAMRVLTAAMQQHGIKRIVSLTGNGVFTAGETPSLLDRFLTAALLFVDPKRVQDGIKHVEVLKDSQLDWVVLRTPKHRNAKQTSKYVVRPTIKHVSLTVSRPNIVACLLELATMKEVVNRLPVISSR